MLLVAPAVPAPLEPLAAQAGNAEAEGHEVQDDVSCASSLVDEEYVFEGALADTGDAGHKTVKTVVQSISQSTIKPFSLTVCCFHK